MVSDFNTLYSHGKCNIIITINKYWVFSNQCPEGIIVKELKIKNIYYVNHRKLN